jgi:hypothetical protein
MGYLSGQPQDTSTSYHHKPPDVGAPVNDLLLPPPWTTAPPDSGTSFRSLLGFMQRRVSDLVGAPSSDNRSADVGFYNTEVPDEQIPRSYNELHRAG